MILELVCSDRPTDKQTKKAKRFGEGFTWTCTTCGNQLVLMQGEGDYWYWSNPPRESRRCE